MSKPVRLGQRWRFKNCPDGLDGLVYEVVGVGAASCTMKDETGIESRFNFSTVEFTVNTRGCDKPLSSETAAALGRAMKLVHEQMSQKIEVEQVWVCKADGVAYVVRELGADETGKQVCVTPTSNMYKSFWHDERDFLLKFRPFGTEAIPQPPPPPAEFKVGDAVRLAGGSPNDPIMTVLEVMYDAPLKDATRKQASVMVAYVPVYGQEGAIVRDTFPPAALRAVAREAVPPEN